MKRIIITLSLAVCAFNIKAQDLSDDASFAQYRKAHPRHYTAEQKKQDEADSARHASEELAYLRAAIAEQQNRDKAEAARQSAVAEDQKKTVSNNGVQSHASLDGIENAIDDAITYSKKLVWLINEGKVPKSVSEMLNDAADKCGYGNGNRYRGIFIRQLSESLQEAGKIEPK